MYVYGLHHTNKVGKHSIDNTINAHAYIKDYSILTRANQGLVVAPWPKQRLGAEPQTAGLRSSCRPVEQQHDVVSERARERER